MKYNTKRSKDFFKCELLKYHGFNIRQDFYWESPEQEVLVAIVLFRRRWQRFSRRSQRGPLSSAAGLQPRLVGTERRFRKHEDKVFIQRDRMPRLNRTVVLAVLVISSSVFLLFQLYYYRKYVNKVRRWTKINRIATETRINSHFNTKVRSAVKTINSWDN